MRPNGRITDANGNVVGWIVRWDTQDGKKILPVSLIDGNWSNQGMPEPRPLFGLTKLSAARRVFVVEGEKSAEALASIGLVATTSPHGAKSAAKADWSPLVGKEIVLWPDRDAAGEKYMQDVIALIRVAEPLARIKVVRFPDLPEGGDAVDWIDMQEGASQDELRGRLEAMADAADECLPAGSAGGPVVSRGDGNEDELGADGDAAESWPDPPADDAFYGLAGEFVSIVAPHSEADRAALLVQFLTGVGNVVGRGAHFFAEADQHFPNLYMCLVGETAKSRKGSSWGQVRRILRRVDGEWCENRVSGGLSSGEELILAVCDPEPDTPKDAKARGPKSRSSTTGGGVADKRLLVVESEFAAVLKTMGRRNNTLSAILRQAWDSRNLATMTKNSPLAATGAHISVIAHITRDELRRLISATEMANGLANRFLWICAARSKFLPDGGNLSDADLRPVADELALAMQSARSLQQFKQNAKAGTIWHEVYPPLSAGRSGLLGAATSRAEAQVMRLAMIYALLDCTSEIGPAHLKAALAVWKYPKLRQRTSSDGRSATRWPIESMRSC